MDIFAFLEIVICCSLYSI